MTDKTSLGDRQKMYEMQTAGRRLMPLLPVCVRLDGKNFSTFTRGLRRPYDARLSALMVKLTNYLVAETGAVIGYTQSDEISLVLYSDSTKSQIYFDGRVQKIETVLAAKASVRFNRWLAEFIPEKADQEPVFDCRVWNVPTKMEAVNALLWREQDATRNSVTMAAREYYSHRELFKKSGKEMQAMLLVRDVNWNDYPAFFKRGTFVQKRKALRAFSAEELEKLPAKHEARANPSLQVERQEIVELEMPPLGRVTNRVDVVFDGQEPEVE